MVSIGEIINFLSEPEKDYGIVPELVPVQHPLKRIKDGSKYITEQMQNTNIVLALS
ncbi:hypothetical protein D3C85_1584130 [compost metagenome]